MTSRTPEFCATRPIHHRYRRSAERAASPAARADSNPNSTEHRSAGRRVQADVMRLSSIPCLGECGPLWNLVWRQTRRCFKSAAEIEEGNQSRHFPDRLLVPADVPQRLDVLLVYEARRLGELAGVTEQGSGLRIQLVLGPCRREFMAQMFIARQAANCRRVEAQSRGTTDLAIDYRCQHLTLESTER